MIESNKEFENMFLDALNDGKAKAFKRINLSDNPF
jgi:hypothetical protein